MLFSKYYPQLVTGLKWWSCLQKQKYGGHGVIRSNKDVLLYEWLEILLNHDILIF